MQVFIRAKICLDLCNTPINFKPEGGGGGGFGQPTGI